MGTSDGPSSSHVPWSLFAKSSLCSTMWVKQPSGAEKRKRRNGRLTNSELNRATIRASAKPKSKPTARPKTTGAEGTEQQGSSALEKSDATSSGVKSARSEEKESEVTLPAAGSQSKAFEKNSETATGQLHPVAQLLCKKLGWGPYDPEL